MPSVSLSLASHLEDPSPRPGVLSAGWWGESLGWGGTGRKQWRDFPGQWGPCEEAWRGVEGEFSRPTSHRTNQPAQPGSDLPQCSPKGLPPSWRPGPGLPERRSRDHGGKRKRCELCTPLPSPTEASLGRGLGARALPEARKPHMGTEILGSPAPSPPGGS